MKVDVPALLRRIAAVGEVPEEVVLRIGTTMAVRWWRLNACVDPQFRYVGQGRWLPGISLWGCDPDGRFGQTRFFLFDEVTDALVDMPRVERFLSLFSEARRTARQRACRATLAHVASADAGANKALPNAATQHAATQWPTWKGAKLAGESRAAVTARRSRFESNEHGHAHKGRVRHPLLRSGGPSSRGG